MIFGVGGAEKNVLHICTHTKIVIAVLLVIKKEFLAMEKETELKELSFEEAIRAMHRGGLVTYHLGAAASWAYRFSSSFGDYRDSDHNVIYCPMWAKSIGGKFYLGDVREQLKAREQKKKEEDRFKEIDILIDDNWNWGNITVDFYKKLAHKIIEVAQKDVKIINH